MKTIWKFPIEGNVANIQMPLGAKLLAIKSQHNKLQVWAYVDTEEKNKEVRKIIVFKTGTQDYPEDDQCFHYIDTILIDNDATVCHVFEQVALPQTIEAFGGLD